MILPVYGYGHGVLRKEADDIDPDYPELQQLIANMWETMYHAKGIGLAAPQIGKSIRLFLVDTEQSMEDEDVGTGIKKVFINAHKVQESGKEWAFEEGCLSIPGIRGDVDRPKQIRLKYLDENFVEHDEVFDGINARVIQHEYDHIDGVLFTDKLKPIKKRLVQKKLLKVKEGKTTADYPMKWFVRRR
ncbi:MAG: peptide deformylase [Bacteroidota bacterium]